MTGDAESASSFISFWRAASRTTRVNCTVQYVKRFYDAVSTFKISLPTPIMSGVRTPTRQFSYLHTNQCGDGLDSINATSSAIVKYVSQRAGSASTPGVFVRWVAGRW
ncbi:hypothetical protein ACLBOM_14230 [Escherichia coli]